MSESVPADLEAMGKPLRELQDAFARQADAWRPALWRYCLRLTGSPWDAEDLVQEALTRAFARLTGFWQPLDARAYLFRVASNAWIDEQRRGRQPLEELDPETLPHPHPQADTAETWSAMEALVGLLPPRQRVIVLLVDVFDFTAREVAAMIGSTEGAVRAALHRARTVLASMRESGAQARGEPAVDVATGLRPPTPLVARYLDAFNSRDPDAVAALLSEDVTSVLVGVAEEQGLDVVRRNSLSDWAKDPPMWAEAGRLDGRDVVFVYFGTSEDERALAWIITLETEDGRITRMFNYCFCPDLLAYAAAGLAVPTSLYGYRVPPA